MLSGGLMAQSLMSTLSSPKKRMEKNLSKALESQDPEAINGWFRIVYMPNVVCLE